jgi:hypothetical protein
MSKQEILEEAAKIGDFAEKKYLKRLDNFQKVDFKDGVFEGVKWMQEQAKEIEKQMIIDAYLAGYSATENKGDSEQYYNETYKKDK